MSLAGLLGHWVLLWWYPKAATPGCTVEGQCLRDRAEDLRALDCVVLGASFDTQAENKAFRDKQDFGFTLLSDVDRTAGAAYGVVRPGGKYAKYAQRHSFLIDPTGRLARIYDVDDVSAHGEQVVADLRALGAG